MLRLDFISLFYTRARTRVRASLAGIVGLFALGLSLTPTPLQAAPCPGNTYFWIGASTGNWTTAGNWSNTSNGPACTTGSGPYSSATVIFDGVGGKNGFCTLDVNNITVSSLTLASGFTGVVADTGNYTLTVSSNFSLSGGTFKAGTSSITVTGSWFVASPGIFTAATSTITFNGAGLGRGITNAGRPFSRVILGGSGGYYTLLDSMTVSTITINSGSTLDIGGLNFSDVNATASSITVVGTLVLKSTGAIQGIPLFVAGSTAIYNGSAAGSVVLSTWTYRNLQVNGSAGTTFNATGDLYVNENLTLTSGILDTKSGGAYTVVVSSNWVNNGGSFTVRGSTVILNGTNPQTVRSRGAPFQTIYVGSGTSGGYYTLIDSISVSTVTVTGANTLDIGGLNVSGINGGASSMTIVGTVVLKGTGTTLGIPTFVAGSTASFTGNLGTSVVMSTWVYRNLQINGSGGVFTMTGNVYVREDLSLNAGTFDTKSAGAFPVTVGGNWNNSGGIFIVRGSTVILNGTSTGLTIRSRGNPFQTIYVGSGTSGGYYTAIDSMSVSTTTVTSSNTLDIGGLNLNGINGGASSMTVAGILVLNGTGTFQGNPTFVSGSTATYSGSLANAVVLSTWVYRNLQINGSGTFTVIVGSLTVNENLLLAAGTLDDSPGNFTIGVSSNWVNTNGIFKAGTSTVTFRGTSVGQTIKSNANPFGYVQINGSGGYWTLMDSMTITSTLTVTAGTLDANANSQPVALAGNILIPTNGGAFKMNTSTLTLNGTAAQIINTLGNTAGQTYGVVKSTNCALNGVTFASSFTATGFVLDGASLNNATTVYFQALSTFTFTSFTLLGANNTTLPAFIRSTTNGSNWHLNASTNNVANVNVRDSDARSGNQITGGSTSIDGTNNKNWDFGSGAAGVLRTWWGTSSSNWLTGSNWDIGIPLSQDSVMIVSTATNMPALTTGVTISSLTINSGAATLSLNGTALTVSSFTVIGHLVLVGTETVSTAPNNVVGSTVMYNSAGTSIVLSSWTYRNLQINGGTNGLFNLTDDLDVNETLTLTAGTLDTTSAGYSIFASSNWINTGGNFITHTSSVIFNSSNGQTIRSRGSPFMTVYIGSATSGGYYTLLDSITVSTITIVMANTLDVGGLNVGISSFTNIGTLVLKGTGTITTWPNSAPTLVDGSTVTYNGNTAGAVVMSTWTYRHLQINGSGGTFSLTGLTDVNENLTLTAGTLDATTLGYSLVVSSNWNNTGGLFQMRTSSVIFNSSNGQTIRSRGMPFQNVFVGTDTTGGYYTLIDSMSVSTITVTVGNTLDLLGQNINGLNNGNSSMTVVGTIVLRGTGTTRGIPTFVSGSTASYTGNLATSLVMSTWTYRNLQINGSGGTFTAGGNLYVRENLTLSAGTLDAKAAPGGFAITVSSDWNNTGGVFTTRTSSVIFNSPSGQTVRSAGSPFFKIWFGSNTSGGYYTLVDSITASTSTIVSSNTLDLDGLSVAISSFTNMGTLLLQGIETISNPSNNVSGSTVTFYGNAGGAVVMSTWTYRNLIIDGVGGNFTLVGGSTTVNENLVLANGTLDDSSGNFTIGVSSNWVNTNGVFKAGTSTVTFRGSSVGQTIESNGSPFGYVQINGAGGYWTLIDSMTITSTLTLNAGTLDATANSQPVALAGNVLIPTNGGNFKMNTSTLTLNGTVAQIINTLGNTAGQTYGVVKSTNCALNGVTFRSSFTATGFVLDGASLNNATTIYFQATSTFTFTNLTLIGANNTTQPLFIRSSTNGTNWHLNASTYNVANVNVRDSDARPGSQIIASNSIDGTNNKNWDFGGAGVLKTWWGGTSTNWFLGSNWDTGVPATQDSALIVSTASNMPGLISDVTISSLTINSGAATLSLNGSDLTVSSLSVSGHLVLVGTETVNIEPDNIAGSTVTYNSAGASFVLSTWTYRNLQINGGTNSSFDATGDLDVNETLTLSLGELDMTPAGYSIVASSNWINTGGNFTAQTSTVIFNSSNGQTIRSRGSPFMTVYIGSGTTGGYYTLLDSITVSTVSVASANTLDIGGLNVGISSWTIAGTLVLKGTGSITNLPYTAPTLVDGSTVTYSGNTVGAVVMSTWTYRHLQINGAGGTFSLTGLTEVNENLRLAAGTLDATTLGYSIVASSNWLNTGGNYTMRTSSVIFNSPNGQIIRSRGSPFYTVYIGTETTGGYYTLTDSITASFATIMSPATLDVGGLNVGISSFTNIGTLLLKGTGTITSPANNVAGSTVTYYSNLATSIVMSTWTYRNLQINGSGGTFKLTVGSTTVNEDLTITAGTFDNTVGNFTIGVSNNWVNTSGVYKAGTSTVTFRGTTSGLEIESNGNPFGYVQLNGSGGYWTLIDSMTITSTLTVTAGTLDADANSVPVAVAGNITIPANGGVFKMNTSTLTLNGAAAQIINTLGNAAGQSYGVVLSSNIALNGVTFASSFTATGLTINGAGLVSATTVYFQASSTFTLTNLTMLGSNNTTRTVFMRSTISGTTWYLNASTNNVANVNVKDSDARPGNLITALTSLNQGNNRNWDFGGVGVLKTWWGGNSANWYGGLNWDSGVPAQQDSALIVSTANPNMPSLTANVSISTLTINSGATMRLAGYNLTIASFTNSGMFVLVGTETVSRQPNGYAGSTVTYNSMGTSIVFSSWPYRNLQINGVNGVFTVTGGSLTVNENLVLTAGTLDDSGGNYTIGVSSNWVNTGGNFTAGSSTVTFRGTSVGQTIRSRASPFGYVQISGSGGYWTLIDSMTIASTLTVTAGTLDATANTQPLALAGNILIPANGGVFKTNTSTLTLNGSAAQIINTLGNSAGQTYGVVIDSNPSSGGVTFASSFTATGLWINSKDLASPTTVYFNAGSTFTITYVTLTGSSGNMIWMRPTPNNQIWLIKNVSTNTISYVNVAYSSASAGVTMTAGPNSIDSNNNTNWTFTILSVTLSAHAYDFTTVNLGATTLSVTPVTVTHGGNVPQTYWLSIATTGVNTEWTVGLTTPTAFNDFVMEGLFNSVQPSISAFNIIDLVKGTPLSSTSAVYAGNDENGVSTPLGSQRHLWMYLFMPLKTSTTQQQQMDLTVTATTP